MKRFFSEIWQPIFCTCVLLSAVYGVSILFQYLIPIMGLFEALLVAVGVGMIALIIVVQVVER